MAASRGRVLVSAIAKTAGRTNPLTPRNAKLAS